VRSSDYIDAMAKNVPPTPPIDPPDPLKMTSAELFDRLEKYEFECPGGPLRNAVEWIELRRRFGAPSNRWRGL